MEKFDVHILGCGSAKPTTRHNATSQVIDLRDKLYMIDCGEGTQSQYRRAGLSFSRLGHIFISHLHGDHCFGLIGLISTLGLLGRTATLYIHAFPELETLMRPWLQFFCEGMPYEVEFHPFPHGCTDIIYEDRSVSVQAFPLSHRIPCCGFVFQEKPTAAHIKREMIDFYEIPFSQINRIKNGEDYVTPEGQVVPNSRLTTPAATPRKDRRRNLSFALTPRVPKKRRKNSFRFARIYKRRHVLRKRYGYGNGFFRSPALGNRQGRTFFYDAYCGVHGRDPAS